MLFHLQCISDIIYFVDYFVYVICNLVNYLICLLVNSNNKLSGVSNDHIRSIIGKYETDNQHITDTEDELTTELLTALYSYDSDIERALCLYGRQEEMVAAAYYTASFSIGSADYARRYALGALHLHHILVGA